MFETFLIIMIAACSFGIHEAKNTPKNYGWFQEDYWEQNDINSMDWDHPLRETPEGYWDHPYGETQEGLRQEENTKGRYFPKDKKKKKDKKKIVPPKDDNNKDKEEPLIIS